MRLIDEFNDGRTNEPDLAKRILFMVFNDLIQRVGFNSFWHSLGVDIQNEILEKNLRTIKEELNRAGA